MKSAPVFLLMIIVALSGCSTFQRSGGSRPVASAPPQERGPIGTFVGSTMKVRLKVDGTYLAEDLGPPEYWMMVEGHTPYPQRIKFPPQSGHWSWNSQTGQLWMSPDSSRAFRWDTAQLRYDKSHPDRLAWGDNASLERLRE